MRKTRRQFFIRWIGMAALALAFLFPIFAKGDRVTTASAYVEDAFIVQRYDVDMTVRADRKLEVKERITVYINAYGGSMFYRSLPTDGARYENIQASCAGNDEFYYYVADNEEVGGFIDVNCVGNVDYGKTWTYDISYVMEQGANTVKNGMIVDVIGYGWTVPLHNVTVDVHFPEAPTSTKIYKDVFGNDSGNEVKESWSADKKTLRLSADRLQLAYSDAYNEVVAGGITLQFEMQEGVLKGYAATRFFTKELGKILIGCGCAVALALLLALFLGNKRDVIMVVNVTAPDDMDPMKMGKWIDGTINNEDITSMVYYFADKGYLSIDLSDRDDPVLISEVSGLPEDAPVYEKTLFEGLFNGAGLLNAELSDGFSVNMRRAVKVSELEGKFYQASQTAIKQVPDAPSMYKKKSIFAYFGGVAIGVLLAFLMPLLLSKRIGGGYGYYFGMIMVIPLGLNAFIGYLCENYRYKWKRGKRFGFFLLQCAIALLFTAIFTFVIAEHVMTEFEKLWTCIGAFGAAFLTQGALSRTEEYLKALEDILGFKEFIVVTEEEKIKVMLEENPHLYYKVLPYAQVLGVTDEWEGKFKKLLVQPPTWCSGTDLTWFDCYLLNRCITRSMMASMTRAAMSAMNNAGGRFVGRSGGGGSFGGFGGGGFGGGGGGIR